MLASAAGSDPRPVFAGAGVLTLATVAVARFAALAKEELPGSVSATTS